MKLHKEILLYKQTMFSIVSVLGILFISNANAQEIYGTGFIITTSNDTIKGSFKRVPNPINIAKVLFIDDSGKETYYKPEELIGFKKGPYYFFYRRVRTGYFYYLTKANAYLKLAIDGPVKLFTAGGTDSQYGNSPISYYLERGDKITTVRAMEHGYWFQMKNYFKDDPEILKKLKKMEYNYGKTPALVRDYNESKLK